MKIYRLNSNINEEMDYEEAIEYLQQEFHFTLDTTFNLKEIKEQHEIMEVLLEAYFTVDEPEENDCYEDDTREREIEYRKVQGF